MPQRVVVGAGAFIICQREPLRIPSDSIVIRRIDSSIITRLLSPQMHTLEANDRLDTLYLNISPATLLPPCGLRGDEQ